MNIRTERLTLRETTLEDCKKFAAWEILPSLTEFFSISKDRSHNQIVSELVNRKKDRATLDLTILLNEKEQPIGRIYISRIDDHSDSADITRIYIGDDSLRGKGYGEEALKAALHLLFMEMNLNRVTLDYFTGNDVASNLYSKLGFVNEGLARKAAKKDDKYYDLNLMSLLKDEYLERLQKA